MPKVYNRRYETPPEGSISIDRGTKYGNPFVIGVNGTRQDVLEKYKIYLKSNPELIEDIKKELKGKNLVCWCKPLACHGDILLEIANERT